MAESAAMDVDGPHQMQPRSTTRPRSQVLKNIARRFAPPVFATLCAATYTKCHQLLRPGSYTGSVNAIVHAHAWTENSLVYKHKLRILLHHNLATMLDLSFFLNRSNSHRETTTKSLWELQYTRARSWELSRCLTWNFVFSPLPKIQWTQAVTKGRPVSDIA